MPAAEFFVGLYATQAGARRDPDPDPRADPGRGQRMVLQKLKRKTGDFATAATAVVLGVKGRKVARAAIALTNAAATRCAPRHAEQALVGRALDEAALNEAARLAMGSAHPRPTSVATRPTRPRWPAR